MVLVYKLEGSKPSLVLIARGLLLGSLAYLSLNLLPALGFAAVIYMVFFTFSEMLSMPFMNAFWISRSQEHNRGQYAAMYTISYSVAQIVSPPLSAYLAERLGFREWWYVVTVWCLLTSGGFMLLQRRLSAQSRAHSPL
jgi:MFS family permease